MLTAAIALAMFQARGSTPTLRQKLATEASAHGWIYMNTELVDLNAPGDNVDVRLAYGSHYITVRVNKMESPLVAKIKLKRDKASTGIRTPMEEPMLKGTGLGVDVADYSTMRIANMKAYAATNMRVTGIVKSTVVFLQMEPPPSAVAPMTTAKSEVQVYDDVIGFAKFISRELKRP